MVTKIVILVVIFIILYSLGSGLVCLVKDKADSHKVVKALTWRISLSVLLFVFLILAFYMGWIKPHGV
jgi:hypothetical protein